MTKKAIQDECKRILHSTKNGDLLNENDKEFMLNIFQNHPNWNLKKGVGIKAITTTLPPPPMNRYNCFYLIRLDGSGTDISYLAALKGADVKNDLKSACREAICPIIGKFLNDNLILGKSRCAVTGELLKKGKYHVDHYDMKFEELYYEWIKNYDMNVLLGSISKSEDNNFRTYFTDEKIKKSFIEFHNANTHLRLVTQKVNLSLLKK